MACLKSRKSFKAFLPMRKIFFMLIEFLPFNRVFALRTRGKRNRYKCHPVMVVDPEDGQHDVRQVIV
jgi:hypothetical protein